MQSTKISTATPAKKEHRFRVGNLEYRVEKGGILVGVFEVIVESKYGYDTYKYLKIIPIDEARQIYANSKGKLIDLILDTSFFMSQTWFTPEGHRKACNKRDQEMWQNGIAWNE